MQNSQNSRGAARHKPMTSNSVSTKELNEIMQSMINMQNSNENNQPSGMVMPPTPTGGYAYNPLMAHQMPLYPPAPQYQYKPGQGSMEELSNSFAAMKPPIYSGNPATAGGISYMPQMAYPDGRSIYGPRPASAVQPSPYIMPQYVQYSSMPGSSSGQYVWNGMSGMPSGSHAQNENTELPTLARRNSSSSNEAISPKTPFMAGQHPTEYYKKPAGTLSEPSQVWSTPSPYSLTYGIVMPQQLWKADGEYQPFNYDELCAREPPIPPPVPAIFSSEKSRGTLDKCLKNDTNTTNVYIRGLHPNTTDEMLEKYGGRFGEIISAKSMLEQITGACKGFGFIKYHNFDDGENCIRGFFHMGYEAKWARVSHNERLKTLSDEANTNLYISNLPMSFNEQMLMSVFSDYEVLSSKILRDDNGISRGVGFARFASPAICHEIITKFNNHPVAEGFSLSIRFADTPDQKKLKNLTNERRQFKTAEYNTAAYGPGSPYASQASPVGTQFSSPLPVRYPTLNPLQAGYGGYSPVATYHPSTVPAVGKSVTYVHGAATVSEPKLDSPSVAAHARRASTSYIKDNIKFEVSEDEHETGPLVNITNTNPRAKKTSPAKSARDDGSPIPPSTRDGGARTTPSKTPRGKRI